MGHQLTNYEGAVAFIDLLGFGALTNGKIQLKKEDFQPWLSKPKKPFNHQFLAATLLVEFRSILRKLNRKFTDLTVAQLSDCFFAWSRQTETVIRFTHAFMHEAILRGLLCRGGMAYGQVIETESQHQLGRLIVGDAVTKAAGLEKIAKGARILTEPGLVMSMHSQNEEFSYRMREFFLPFENPLDYSLYDEFRWYLTSDLRNFDVTGPSNCTNEQKIRFTQNRLQLDTLLIYSPKFRWNARSDEGMIQLKATSNFLSTTGLLGIHHEFERRGFPTPEYRSEKRVESTNEFVNSDINFHEGETLA